MSTLKAIGIALGKKGAIAAKVAIVTLGVGAATTGVVVLNDQYQEDAQKTNQQVNQSLITSENKFDEEKAQLLLDLNELFESPIVEENTLVEESVASTPISTSRSVLDFTEPTIKQLSDVPRIDMPAREATNESASKTLDLGSFANQFSSDDYAYFDKFGLQRRIQPASFLGGQDELATFVNENIEYPEDALQDGIEGLVEVGFTVDQEGNISDVHTIKGVNASLNAEAERIVRNFPNWVPQQVNSEFVKSNVSIPIRFEIN